MAVRLYVLQARSAPRAVVLRRGPSKQTLMCLWRTDIDEVEEGQWLKGRVYERRCDLSPGGKRLIYFAASYKEPFFSWTAVSRPPFFTALALWPKGDGWGGGGLFSSELEVELNHRGNEMGLARDFALPRRVRVRPFGDYPGWGEDSPIWDERIRREGWVLRDPGRELRHPYGAPIWFEYSPAVQWSRPEPGPGPRHELWMCLHGIKERDGPWYITRYHVKDTLSGELADLSRCDWADWSLSGDLLIARSGKLLRLARLRDGALAPVDSARCVVDLTDRTFAPLEAPPWARTWFSDLPEQADRGRGNQTIHG